MLLAEFRLCSLRVSINQIRLILSIYHLRTINMFDKIILPCNQYTNLVKIVKIKDQLYLH